MTINAMTLADGYKADHRRQYPNNTTLVYSNWTPRGSRISGIDKVVFFGLQYFIKQYLMEDFKRTFFDLPKEKAVAAYKRRMDNYLGKDSVSVDHIGSLHDLGYIPVEIKALPEGSAVDIKVPMFTIKNTKPEFFWITNYLETLLSCVIWMPCTSATIALEYRKLLNAWANKTSDDIDFVQWQGHDFSFRGLPGIEAAMMSAAGHLLSFTGTDTIPAIDFLEKYYNANSDNELIGGSVPATEHSVICAGDKDGEFETFKRLITEIYPNGVVSIVSDTWDLWKVLTDFLPKLKTEIMSRAGKVVIRPDSGNPVDIICGEIKYAFNSIGEAENFFYNNLKDSLKFTINGEYYQIKSHSGNEFIYESIDPDPDDIGVIELLWETFGGTINSKGYKQLDSHIGAIYGDSITLERANEICKRLEAKGFASTNIVFGIGSFTYQYNTRDTFGFAMKATYVEVDGIGRPIFKNPVTDDGTKKSAKGLLQIERRGLSYKLHDNVSLTEERSGSLNVVFSDGVLYKDDSLSNIRDRVKRYL